MQRVSVGTSGWVGLHAKDFARRFDAVEFNWTFHERDDSPEKFRRQAADLQELRLQAILKVSGLATHENRLRSPELWWPGLWAKYAELHQAGVLGGLLWQMAPSFQCNRETLGLLEALARRLPKDVLHIFEFRHRSWYQDTLVGTLLTAHGLCLAWAHIQNDEGWCGDLPSGWVTQAKTCGALYLRLFGTKKKAIGRYSQEFLEDEILPHLCPEPGQRLDAFVIFAQADVPDHAKADALAMVEVLGRPAKPFVGRSTVWERQVLATTLGLAEGAEVDGVVTRITHRTVFLDVGRSCRAFLDANHARRQGLLEELRIGTTLERLVVESVDFQGEWGLIGLSCHLATIGSMVTLADAAPSGPSRLPEDAPMRVTVEPPAAQQGRRWRRTPDEQALPPQPRLRRSPKEIVAAANAMAATLPEFAEEPCIVSRSLSPERERPLPELGPEAGARASRWGRSRTAAAPAPEISATAASRDPVAGVPEWPDEGPLSYSKDELLVIEMERRLDKEGGADRRNAETFGEDANASGWSVEDMFSANELLRHGGDMFRANEVLQHGGVLCDSKQVPAKKGRNKITAADAEEPPILFQ